MVRTGLVSCLLAFVFAVFLSVMPLVNQTALAAGKCAFESDPLSTLPILTIKPWYSGVCKPGTNDVEIVSIPGDIVIIMLNVLSIGMQLAGYAAVGLVIWGGIKYILANGESGKIAAAKSTIQNALIGLLIVLVAITIVDFITNLYA